MFSNYSTLHVSQPRTHLLFKGDSYEFWSIKMKTLLKSEGLLNFVETDHTEASDYKVHQKEYEKQDAKALFIIQQAVDESIFSSIAAATSAKQAWSLLKNQYQGSEKELKLTFPVANKDAGLEDVHISVQSLLKCIKKGENQAKQSSPTIYMVPSTVKDHNLTCYKPRLVSIGPLHREEENLQAGEGEKAVHVFSLLSRVNSMQEETLQACALKVNASINQIRSCYAETIAYNNAELTKIMVMDGCFILEFLYRITKREKSNLGNMMFIQFTIYDLVLLENQIPFLVLQHIFECTISKFDQTASLINLIHAVLEQVNPFKEHKLKSSSSTAHHHILGLLHECFQYENATSSEFPNSRFPSAVELDRAGVNFKRVRDTEWPLVMEVKLCRLPCFSCSWGKPTLIMPVLDINDFTGLVLRNLIAYEQFSDNITQYITSCRGMIWKKQEENNELLGKTLRSVFSDLGSFEQQPHLIFIGL
ncbi:UPF0481 protein At3g47200-like [Bidens hawaiensis]|uniref:UPF0481 protein At3g47200-like n=1 Tax=Bidens hawaiensis TaxID=980011 RepID=UPI00404AC185